MYRQTAVVPNKGQWLWDYHNVHEQKKKETIPAFPESIKRKEAVKTDDDALEDDEFWSFDEAEAKQEKEVVIKEGDKRTDEEKLWDSRTTAADRSGDKRSLRRNLDKNLYLVVKTKMVNSWHIPMDPVRQGDTMRMALERLARIRYGRRVEVHYLGNAPATTMEIVEQGQEVKGTKVFFYYCQYIQGQLKFSPDVTDFMWLTKPELKEHISAEAWEHVHLCLRNEL